MNGVKNPFKTSEGKYYYTYPWNICDNCGDGMRSLNE